MQFQLFLTLCCSLFALGYCKEYVRGCYFTNWAQYRLGRGKYKAGETPYESGLCTHIFFAFAKIDNHVLKSFEWNDETKSGNYEQVINWKKSQPDLKVLLSVGGWNHGTGPFMSMSATPATRAIFIKSTLDLLLKHKFDGFDLDWEYPVAGDKSNFVALVAELKAAFAPHNLLLTAAVAAAPEKQTAGLDASALNRLFDFVNVMTYDYHGSWEKDTVNHQSPLFARAGGDAKFAQWNLKGSLAALVALGFSKDKLIVGMSTYGRGWKLAGSDTLPGAAADGPSAKQLYTREKGIASYYELCDMLAAGAKRYWEPEQRVPYLVYKGEWFGYDDAESLAGKAKWAKQMGYGGVFSWTLDFDDFNGQCALSNGVTYPLHKAINAALEGDASSIPVVTPPTAEADSTTATEATEEPTEDITTTPQATPTSAEPAIETVTDSELPPADITTTTQAATTTEPTVAETTTDVMISEEEDDEDDEDVEDDEDDNVDEQPCTGNEMVANKADDCKSYYSCSNGHAFKMNCPPGLKFNSATLNCDWPENVEC